MYANYKDRAEFLLVIIREAGHKIPGLEFVLTEKVDGLEARREQIQRILRMKQLSIPTVIDFDSKVQVMYSAWPERILVVDSEGKVAHDGGRGLPFGWDCDAVEECLQRCVH